MQAGRPTCPSFLCQAFLSNPSHDSETKPTTLFPRLLPLGVVPQMDIQETGGLGFLSMAGKQQQRFEDSPMTGRHWWLPVSGTFEQAETGGRTVTAWAGAGSGMCYYPPPPSHGTEEERKEKQLLFSHFLLPDACLACSNAFPSLLLPAT